MSKAMNPGAGEVVSNVDAQNSNGPITITRRFNISVQGTMSNFGLSGPQAATWHPGEGMAPVVFGPMEHEVLNADHNSATNCLRNAVIKKATILESRSTFPVPLGVSISCLPSDEVTFSGEKYAYTVLPLTSSTTPNHIFEAKITTQDSEQWTRNYRQYNSSNLETHNVLEVQKCPYLFVHEDHPVIELLRINKELLANDIDGQQKIDDQWYKVTRQVFNSCCQTLRNRVLTRLNTRDLNAFSVQLHKLNGVEWGDIGSGDEALTEFKVKPEWDQEKINAEKTIHLKNFLESPYSYMARLELVYELQP